MHPLGIMKALVLLTLANTTPLLAKRLARSRCSYPIDGGIRILDGESLLGESKTIRGISLALLVTSVSAPLVGVDWKVGLRAASAAMAGDLLSSFIKRRTHLPPSSRATGLDQVPESLFPLLACRKALSLSTVDIAAGVLAFVVREVVFSRLLYKYRLRDQPY